MSVKTKDGTMVELGKPIVDTITPDAKPSWEPGETTHEISFSISEFGKEHLKNLQSLMAKAVEKQAMNFYKLVNAYVEEIVRTRVSPPIKGEITRGKVKWRGLSLAYGTDTDGVSTVFYGVIQRGTLYCVDGKDYPIEQLKERIKL